MGESNRKKIISLFAAVVIILICIICILLVFSKKSFKDLADTDHNELTKVVVTSGSDGSHVEFIDADKIKELVSVFESCEYRKVFFREKSTGYSFYFDFYSGNEVVLRITGTGSAIKVDDKDYKVVGEIDTDRIRALFNSAK